MTAAWECADTRQALGVYVLGAIDPAERSLVDRHTSGCRDCRDELAGLAGLQGLLSRVPADEVGRISREDAEPLAADVAPRENFVDSLVTLTAARRRRNRRWQVLAAAAAVVIAAAGSVAGLRLASGSSVSPQASTAVAPPANWQTARTASAMKGISATVRYARLSWGMAYDVQITGVPAGTTCELWVTDSQGVHLAAGGWTVSRHDFTAWYPGSSWVPASQVQGLDVTAGNQQLATFTTN